MRTYEVNPRPVELGGGWNLKFYEDGDEMGGGVFPPVPTPKTRTSMQPIKMPWTRAKAGLLIDHPGQALAWEPSQTAPVHRRASKTNQNPTSP